MNNYTSKFISLAKHPVKFRMFLFFKLPAAFFSGVRIQHINAVESKVIVPYKWFTRNPFSSTYFACLSMAAELSTGSLIMMNIYDRQPGCSMLVKASNAVFVKKAIDYTIFTCTSGREISKIIEEVYLTNVSKEITIISEGRNDNNEVVATFEFTWSFKLKPQELIRSWNR